jgi:N-acetyl-gamma-glutamyl-phosphate reductase
MVVRVGIIGASGFTGAELLRLVAGHPDFEVVVATGDSQAGTRVADLYPSLAVAHPELTFVPHRPGLADDHRLDVVLLGLPTARPQNWSPTSSPRAAWWWTSAPTSA